MITGQSVIIDGGNNNVTTILRQVANLTNKGSNSAESVAVYLSFIGDIRIILLHPETCRKAFI